MKKAILLIILLFYFLASYRTFGDSSYTPTPLPDKEQIVCVVNALKYEARPSFKGRRAVFDVINNRSNKFRQNWCQVIFAKSQFSFIKFHWDRKLSSDDLKIYYEVVVTGEPIVDEDVLFYHATSISLPWKGMRMVGNFDGNIFYKKVVDRR